MSKFWIENKKYIYFILFAVFLLVLFKYIIPFFGPLFLALLISFLLYPAADFLSRKMRMRKSFLYISILLTLSILLCALLLLFLYLVGKQGLFFLKHGDTTLEEMYSGMNLCCCYFERKLCLKNGILRSGVMKSVGIFKKYLIENKLADLFSGSMSLAKIFAKIGAYLVVFYVGTVLLYKEMEKNYSILTERLNRYLGKVSCGIRSYLLAQMKIMTTICMIAYLGLFLSGMTRNIIYALLIAFLDVLPFIGTGIILVPLSAYCLLSLNYRGAAILLIAYIVCIVARQFLEPKLIGKQFGMPPFLTLTGIFLGVKVFGIAGILLGPAYFLILTSVYKEMLCNS